MCKKSKKPTRLAWLDVYCIDIQKAALVVDMTFNTDKTGFDNRLQYMFS